jgi:hypothetical protein
MFVRLPRRRPPNRWMLRRSISPISRASGRDLVFEFEF